MAVLTDLLVAPESDVSAIIVQWPRSKAWAGLEATGLDGIMLSELAAALGETELAEEIATLGPTSFAVESGGPWVYVLPIEFQESIAEIAAGDITSITHARAEREEARQMGLPPQVAEGILNEIHELAVEAGKAGQRLLLWVSL